MKKLLIYILVSCTSLIVFSCGGAAVIKDSEKHSIGETDTAKEKILIVYFSRTGENYGVGYITIGNTAKMAGFMQDFTGGDIYEIVPAVPYPDNYEKMLEVSQNEIASNARPAIKNPLENLDRYSIVFVGSPIWYDAPPMIIRTFYETHREELAGKTLVPFGTHEGSGVNSCASLMKEYFPEAKILEGFGVVGRQVDQSRKSVEEWLRRIGVPEKDQSKNNEKK